MHRDFGLCLKMMESHEYMNIGSWWERKKGKEANEIDIVGIKVDDTPIIKGI